MAPPPKCFAEGLSEPELEECFAKCMEDQANCPTFNHIESPSVCTLVGDPHIKTFDSSLIVNTHAYGKLADYWVFKSVPLSVQARYASTRPDNKAQVSGVIMTGPLLGKNKSSNVSEYNVLEIPLLEEGTALRFNGIDTIHPKCHRTKPNRPNRQFGSCELSVGNVVAKYGRGRRAAKYFDADWMITDDGRNVTVRKWAKKTLTVSLEIGGVVIAEVIVNNGKRKQNLLLEAQHGFLDPLFAGNVSGHCGNANGNVTDDNLTQYDLDEAAYVPVPQSMFSTEHPLLNATAIAPPCNRSKEFTEICKQFHKTVDLEAFKDAVMECVIDCCASNSCPVEDAEDPPAENCPSPQGFQSCGLWGDPHFSHTFKTSRLEHGSRAAAVEFHGAGLYSLFKTGDNASKDLEAQVFFCDSDRGTTSLCGLAVRQGESRVTWMRPAASGPPAFGSQFVHGTCINGDCSNNALELALNNRPLPFEEMGPAVLANMGTDVAPPAPESLKYLGCFSNDAGRNLPHRWGSGSGFSQEACGSACAMKGFTLMGLEYGGECWCGYQLKSDPAYAQVDDAECSGMQTCAGGEEFPLCGNGYRTAISEIGRTLRQGFSDDDFFAQQHVDPGFATNVAAPACVGDHDRDFLVKTVVPLLNKVYEPVVTLEVHVDVFAELQVSDQICMAQNTEEAMAVAPVDIMNSVFTTHELRQLCQVCGMLDEVVSDGDFHGCNNPSKGVPPELGSSLCEQRNMLPAATTACSAFADEAQWLNACLLEYCNDDDPQVQAFIAAEHAEWTQEMLEEELQAQAAKAADRVENVQNPKYLGCFIDSSSRMLKQRLTQQQSNSAYLGQGWNASGCIAECSRLSFNHAALQYGGECWCDVKYNCDTDHSKVSDDECLHMQGQCDGEGKNNGLPCGSGWRNAVYCVHDCQGSAQVCM